MTKTLILSLTEMSMLSRLVFQIIPFYLQKNHKVIFMMMNWMRVVTIMITIILEWNIMLLFMMEERTTLLLSSKPDYQLAISVQRSLLA